MDDPIRALHAYVRGEPVGNPRDIAESALAEMVRLISTAHGTEREACARICDDYANKAEWDESVSAAEEIAALIRSRTQP